MKAILVENRDVCIDVIMSILSQSSIKVIPCADVATAVNQARDNRIDVLILDSARLHEPLPESLKAIPLVLFTTADLLNRVDNWFPVLEKTLSEAALMAASRKNAAEKLSNVLDRIKERIADMQGEVANRRGSAPGPSSERPGEGQER